jgi:sugar phosphate isomerase/epimerase
MKISLADGRTTELGYGYNVLPGESVAALIDQARRICGPVRSMLGVEQLGIGLWIARGAATELRDVRVCRQLREVLEAEGLYCFTLNGFPYGGFHAPRVKERVFEPSWAEPSRLDYTLDLAAILAELMPDHVTAGSISTLPLGVASVDRAKARELLARAADGLLELSVRTGRAITLAIEPEPGAAFERADGLAVWLGDLVAEPSRAGSLGVCLDCCHAAVVGEDPAAAFAAMSHAGVRCPKIQISSALVATRPDLEAVRERLGELIEPRFLHQVRCDLGGTMDLPEALSTMDRTTPWRIHFHVPVHREEIVDLETTRASIRPVLEAAFASPGPLPHLEVETYTWNVLPPDERPDGDGGLVEGISRELAWTLDLLSELGAEPS